MCNGFTSLWLGRMMSDVSPRAIAIIDQLEANRDQLAVACRAYLEALEENPVGPQIGLLIGDVCFHAVRTVEAFSEAYAPLTEELRKAEEGDHDAG